MAAFGPTSASPSPASRKRAKGKTAASLALFPSADETFKDLLPRYPTAAGLLRDPAPLRKGKWSKEEDDLANTCIQHFMEGLIPLSGVGDDTLRGLLSYMLHSDGMRVTKKFAGELSIRKQQYVTLSKQARACRGTPRAMEAATIREELAERFLQSLENRSVPRRRQTSSAAKARSAAAKRRRPESSESPANAAKLARGETSDDSTLAVEVADAAAASMAHLHGFVPAHGFPSSVPVSFPHPASRGYPYAVMPHAAPHSAPHLSSYGDEHHRPLPPSVVPMMPSHHPDAMGHTAATAVFSHTPPPGAGMYAMAMPSVFHDGMRPYGRPLPAMYPHPGAYQAMAAGAAPQYYQAYDGMGRPQPDHPASAAFSAMYFRSAHSPVPQGMMSPAAEAAAASAALGAQHQPSGMDALGAFADEALRGPRGPLSLAAAAAAVEAASSPSPSVSAAAPAREKAPSQAPPAASMGLGSEQARDGEAGTEGLRLEGDSESLGGWTSGPSRNE